MKSLKEISIGFLSAIASSIIILGAILVAMTEGQVMIVPTQQPTVTEPVFIDTLAPGEPTLTRQPIQPTQRPVIVTPTPSFATNCNFPAGWVSYIFQVTDNLSSLAAAHGITLKTLLDGNCLFSPEIVSERNKIYLPPLPTPSPTPTPTIIPTATNLPPTVTLSFTRTPVATSCGRPNGWVTYIVQPGDSLFRLSQAVGLEESVLISVNCLADPNLLRAGQTLWLPFSPRPTATLTQPARPTVVVPTRTFTPRPTFTRTFTLVPTRTPTPTDTPPAPATRTPTNTLPATLTPTNTVPSTHTVTPTQVPTFTVVPTFTDVPTMTQTPGP